MQSKPAANVDTRVSDTESSQPPKTHYALTPLAAAVIAVLHPGSAMLAQETTEKSKAENKIQIDEIIVTATKRAESLQDVPQSITAFGTDAIEKMQFKNMEDYLKALPSASLTSSMPGRNSLVMRGISSGNSEYRTESQVAVYLDDQPVTSISQQPEIRMVDIARIEALPGPQGTLFGSSSQSGTMRIITNKPNMDGFSGQGSAVVSSTEGGDASWDVSGHINMPVNDKLAIRVVGFGAHEGGYVDNVFGETFAPPEQGGAGDNSALVDDNQNTYDITGGRIAALWVISDDWQADIGLISQDSKARGSWESDPYLGDYKITRFFDEWRDDKWWQTAATFRGDLGFAEFTSTTSYFERDSSYEWDNMAYNQWLTSYYAGYSDVYDFDYEYGTTFNDQWQTRFAQEFRLVSQSESKLQWMAGAFYEDVYDEWEYGAKIPSLIDTTAWGFMNDYACYYNANGYDVPCPVPDTDITYWNNYKRTLKQTAVFGELSYDITDKLTATVGARWFKYDRTEHQQYYAPYLVPPPGSYGFGEGLTDASGTESDVVKKVSVQYEIDDARMVYALASEGFRLGGRNSPRVVGNNPSIPATYDSDTLTNYEVGIKSTWLDRRLTVNASYFLMVWDGIQINSRLGDKWWQRGTWNGDTGETSGIEINGTFFITQNFVVEGSAFFADAKYTSDSYSPYCPVTEDGCTPWIYNGQDMPGSPDEKYWLAAEYTVPNAFGLPGDLWFRVDTSYQAGTWDDLDSAAENDPVGYIPAWKNTNVQVGVSLDSDLTIALMVRNVTDERGINSLYSSTYYTDYFGQTGQSELRTLQKPLTFSLSLTKKF
ncbi:MAG: TonB-dependent receptor [Gammaproteobacteria bacterium]|nr:TonB-dependent receptor [Gammaproteobacteria bacterium]